MAHKFKCPVCGKDILVKWLNAGDTARCRACGAAAKVPEKTEEVPDAALPGPSPAASPGGAAARPCCPTCRWLHKAPSVFDSDIGECRRYPPGQHHRWPEVSAGDWCGEHSHSD